MATGQAPISLARQIDEAALVSSNPCETIILGSFWPYARKDYASHLVKSFKECSPVEDYQPHITRLCEFYADLVTERLSEKRFDWVARVLGSTEQKPETTRPLSLLESILCARAGASSITHLFFKTDARPAMRLVGQLSGPDVLARRVRYAAQDLFLQPASLGGTALLIDDIYNTGASMRVYAYALKEFAAIESVTGVNLAATRFKSGKDGLGFLRTDTARFEADPSLRLVWLDGAGVLHIDESCPAIEDKPAPKIRFLAEKQAATCAACCESVKPKRRFWGLLR